MKGHIGAGRAAGLILGGLMVLAAGGCSDKVENGEIKKTLPRPGGGVTAFLVRHETWNNFYYEVFMRDKDHIDDLVFRSTSTYEGPPDLEWATPDILIIRMRCGAIEDYSNAYPVDGDGYKTKDIFIGLEGNKLCKDPSAYVKGASKP